MSVLALCGFGFGFGSRFGLVLVWFASVLYHTVSYTLVL